MHQNLLPQTKAKNYERKIKDLITSFTNGNLTFEKFKEKACKDPTNQEFYTEKLFGDIIK